jgi:16S rRNA processing protein RimM
VTGPTSRLLAASTIVTVAGSALAIRRRAGTDARPIVRLDGIDDRAAVQALRGSELTVDADEAPMLADGEWWASELQGCEVRDGDRQLGTVIRLIELPSCEALEVRPAAGGEPLLVPMVKDAIRDVDTAGRRIEVDLDFLGLAGSSRPPQGADSGGVR